MVRALLQKKHVTKRKVDQAKVLGQDCCHLDKVNQKIFKEKSISHYISCLIYGVLLTIGEDAPAVWQATKIRTTSGVSRARLLAEAMLIEKILYEDVNK